MNRLLAYLFASAGGALLGAAGVDWRGILGVWLTVLAWHLVDLDSYERRMLRRRDSENDKRLFNGGAK